MGAGYFGIWFSTFHSCAVVLRSCVGTLSSTLKAFHPSQRERFPEACPGLEKVVMGNCFAWSCSVKPASAQNRFGSLSLPVPVVECDKPIGPSGNTGLWKMFKKKPAASVEASTSPSAPSQDHSCVISVVEETTAWSRCRSRQCCAAREDVTADGHTSTLLVAGHVTKDTTHGHALQWCWPVCQHQRAHLRLLPPRMQSQRRNRKRLSSWCTTVMSEFNADLTKLQAAQEKSHDIVIMVL
jgi:hypothetical protein